MRLNLKGKTMTARWEINIETLENPVESYTLVELGFPIPHKGDIVKVRNKKFRVIEVTHCYDEYDRDGFVSKVLVEEMV